MSPAAAGPNAVGPIKFSDRVIVAGTTGSGKSLLINYLLSVSSGGAQRFLFDSKPEYSIPGVTPVSDIRDVDWRDPIVHYKVESGDPKVAEVDRVFKALNERYRIVVYVHELSDLCEYNANKAPASVNGFISKGRKFGRGLVGGTQRPGVNVPKRSFTDVQHAFINAGGFVEDVDIKAAAQIAGIRATELEKILHQGHAEEGEYAWLHIDRTQRALEWFTPLTDADRAATIVDDPELF